LANKLTNQKEASNSADVTNSQPGDPNIKQVTEVSGGGGQVTSDADDKQKFVAFARVFSGTLRQGQQLYVLGPKHDPSLLGTLLVRPEILFLDLGALRLLIYATSH
jgi:translation elongation factor EF-G